MNRIFDALRWWIDGLVDIIVALSERKRDRRRLRLVKSQDGYRTDGSPSAPLTFEHGAAGWRFVPEAGAQAIAGRDVDVRLDADEVLVRTLDPLPSDSRPYLDGIVRHHLERLSPWRSDDLLYAFRVENGTAPDTRLVVTVFATARSVHARLLSALQAAHAAGTRLLYADLASPNDAVIIPVDSDVTNAAQRLRARRVVFASLAVMAFLFVAAGSVLALALQRAEAAAESVSADVVKKRQALMASAGARGATAGRDVEALMARKRASPAIVLALETLSAALPDNTWLTEMSFADGKLRLVGVSQDVSALIPLIEGSRAFSDITFFAPTARLPDGRGDRFHLEAKALPAERAVP